MADPLAIVAVMETVGRSLPSDWEVDTWEEYFPRLSTFVATRLSSLRDDEKELLVMVGAMMCRRMTERYDAMTLADIVIERCRSGGGDA